MFIFSVWVLTSVMSGCLLFIRPRGAYPELTHTESTVSSKILLHRRHTSLTEWWVRKSEAEVEGEKNCLFGS